jgi:DNA-directed RNA polymerase subunit M/transcription elongation factor TFIIS
MAQTQGETQQQQGGGAQETRLEPKMLFCARCDNLLYPMTDADNQMRWICRACSNQEEHNDVPLVYSLDLKRELSDMKQLSILSSFAQDPTVKITTEKPCPRCGHFRVAEFINPLELPTEDMSLFFSCTSPLCRHVWKDERRAKAPK